MHSALLIDEILQVVLDFCYDLPDAKPRRTYAQLARCCRAWRDPALDRLWARQEGVGPLLALAACEAGNDKVPTFRAYAERVKRISYQHNLKHVEAEPSRAMVFPRLQSVSLAFNGCMVPSAWAISPVLKRVAVNIGYARSPQACLDRSNAAARLLEQARLRASALCSLHIRGRMTDALNDVVGSLTALRNLTIQGNCFLTTETLAAVARFPSLRTLEVHASHIEGEEFDEALGRASGDSLCFPSLEELTIRTRGSLLASILSHVTVGSLRKLHIDMDACPRGSSYVKPIFDLLAQKASSSLYELIVEDRTDLEELEVRPDIPAGPRWYNVDILAPLARLQHLRRFALKGPDLCDTDLEQLAKWWPTLEHLDLGAYDGESAVPEWKQRMSQDAYAVVAKSFLRLESLVLPELPSSVVDTSAAPQKALRALTLGDVPDASARASAVVDTLLTIFPGLETIDCPNVEITERFETVRSGH